ncbi:MAG: MerR family transcriptional regulator [Dehalococcoidales bacterium]|nr:MerR family transcriptional regulator [Dehalococcoidales bacterium]
MSPKNKSNKIPEEEPRYVISVAARILGTQTHTLRYYERIGIIEPFRSTGNIRLYSESDIIRLRRVKSLIDELGVNLAGVEVIMHMVNRINELQQQVEALEKFINRNDS